MNHDKIRRSAEEIARNFALSIKERTDKLLFMDCDIYCNCGVDTTTAEKKQVKITSRHIYEQLKGIDEEMGSQFIRAID